MVINVIITTTENRSWVICPNNNPCAARINENSPICAKEVAIKKAGFLVYLNRELITIIKKGLTIIIKKRRTSNSNHSFLTTDKDKPIPKETKNNMEKKSRKFFILEIISKLYSKFPRATPAMNAPIAIEKPR